MMDIDTIVIKSCIKVHDHGVKRESGVENKWHCKSFKSVALL